MGQAAVCDKKSSVVGKGRGNKRRRSTKKEVAAERERERVAYMYVEIKFCEYIARNCAWLSDLRYGALGKALPTLVQDFPALCRCLISYP